MGEPYEGVTLILSNVSEVHFLFTIDFINAGVRGYLYHGADIHGRSYLTAKSTLPDDLMAWAVRIGASVPNNPSSDCLKQIQPACDYFLKNAEKSR